MKSIVCFSIAAGLAAMACAGCGILTAPVSVPAAAASNANFSFKGRIYDHNGNPLDTAMLAQQLDHHFWTPIAGGTGTDERHLRRIDGAYKVEERGRELNLTFTRDGYYDAEYNFTASDAKYVSTPAGDWPNADNFPVVLISRQPPDAPLAAWSGDISYANYPRQPIIDFNTLESTTRNFSERSAEESNTLSSGLLFLTLVKEMPRAINSRGDVDPAEVNLPASVTLRISGQESGFVRIAPRLGYAPMQVSDTAPATGYTPEFVISRNRLREMRSSSRTRIMEAHEYFYFRFGNRCGKGFIAWQFQADPSRKEPLPLSFHYGFWLQRRPNDTSLISHQARSI
jgi:hypothetical protein